MATTSLNPNAPEHRYAFTGAVAINTNIFWIDCGRVPAGSVLSLHVISLGTGGYISPEWSIDDANWRAGTMETVDSTPATSNGTQTATMFLLPVQSRYFRLRLSTAITAGSTAILLTHCPGTLRSAWLQAGGANIGQFAARAPEIIVDAGSGAVTASATTSPISPSTGPSYSVNVVVTAVSGTSPTYDLGVEESDDNGTNWFRVYDFPRITANGVYRSPSMPMRGTRIRYVQTLGGTTPSFTRAINRVQLQDDTDPFRQIIDRSVNVNTLNATTSVAIAQNCGNQVKVNVNLSSIGTTAPALQLEGSDDNLNWVAIGTPITGIVGATVANNSANDWAFFRVRVSTAGVGAALGPNGVLIRAHN